MKKYFAIAASVQDGEGEVKYIAIDESSGGYPYEVDTPFRARVWEEHETEELLRYFSMFAGNENHVYHNRVWEIFEIDWSLRPRKVVTVTRPVLRLI